MPHMPGECSHLPPLAAGTPAVVKPPCIVTPSSAKMSAVRGYCASWIRCTALTYNCFRCRFMSLVHDLIVGTLDASQYEDACRALLGELTSCMDMT